jgi:DNA-binding CsgD family transcriptional regulator
VKQCLGAFPERQEAIAGLLVIAESTAKTHVKRVLAKIGARDRAQAVAIAYQSGLMNPTA